MLEQSHDARAQRLANGTQRTLSRLRLQAPAIGASIGIAIAPDHEGRDTGPLLRKADMALYRIENAAAGAAPATSTRRRTQRLNCIERVGLQERRTARRAEETGQLGLYYRPIVDVRAGAVALGARR